MLMTAIKPPVEMDQFGDQAMVSRGVVVLRELTSVKRPLVSTPNKCITSESMLAMKPPVVVDHVGAQAMETGEFKNCTLVGLADMLPSVSTLKIIIVPTFAVATKPPVVADHVGAQATKEDCPAFVELVAVVDRIPEFTLNILSDFSNSVSVRARKLLCGEKARDDGFKIVVT